jgi:chromate reductase, NAD(P)H dehydrogenase (quinone)
MSAPKILIIPGSTRIGSCNVKLAALAVKELTLMDVDATRISLADYELPIYEAGLDIDTVPTPNAIKLRQMFMAHQGVFIATPEYSASVPPLLKNAIDWIARARERGDQANTVFKGRVFAISAASTDRFGGLRALMALRQILEVGCGALTIPEQLAIAHADHAFDYKDQLADLDTANQFRAQLARLVELARLVQ